MDAIPQGLDPTAFILTKAIGRSESNSYDATGDNGTSFGRYQIQKKNWPSWAKQYLGDANAEPTEENQNKLAYSKVKHMLDSGLTQSQVASTWNSGHADPNTVGKGHNVALGVDYDVPGYVAKVQKNYQQVQTEIQKGYNPTPYSTPSSGVQDVAQQPTINEQEKPNQGLLGQLKGRLTDVSSNISDVAAHLSGGGKQSVISDVLQGAGALAGGVNDVVTSAVEHIPVVNKVFGLLEKVVGKGVGALAKTSVGQSIATQIQKQATAHPELSKDIGAGLDIITALPILKGIGVLKNVALDATSVALRDVAKNVVAKDLGEVLSRTGAGREAVAAAKLGASELVERNALPELVTEGGVTRYSTKNAVKELQKGFDAVEGELQAALDRGSTPQVANRVPLENFKQAAIQTAKDELKDTSGVETVFKRIQEKYGDFPTLGQMNEAKRTIAKQISEAAFSDPNITTNKAVRSALQKGIEEAANTFGIDIGSINQKFPYKARDLLEAIDGKTVKNTGLLHEAVKAGSVAAGAGIGTMLGGNTTIGGLLGYGAKGYVEKKLSGLAPRAIAGNILKRSAEGATRQTAGVIKRKVGGLIGAALANKARK